MYYRIFLIVCFLFVAGCGDIVWPDNVLFFRKNGRIQHNTDKTAAPHKLFITKRKPGPHDYKRWLSLAARYLKTGQADSARLCLARCPDPHELAPEYFHLWQQVEKQEGHPDRALYYAERVTMAKDSLRDSMLEQSLYGLERKYNYERFIAENDRLIIENQHGKVYLLLLTVIVLIVVSLLQYHKYRARQKELEQKNALIAREQENNRLTLQQLKLQQTIIETLEFYRTTRLTGYLSDKTAGNSPSVRQMQAATRIELRDRIMACIQVIYPQLYDYLLSHPSNLNATEMLLCCLIHAGFEVSLIVALLNIKKESLYVFRSKIREKLELDKNEDLSSFLAKKQAPFQGNL
ncbi:hypothetical protein [Microbacter margulisiae]|uniref:Cell division protein FtsL n=1 Tax=Microbacter margulisiae TaxID=1350067 RepID=A0A7W5DSN7_9PORP|nr:hypothetical protein [Microbacter margulisiae]MBB3188350.1 cell division protein FtsL [Microbacter margulisiae]